MASFLNPSYTEWSFDNLVYQLGACQAGVPYAQQKLDEVVAELIRRGELAKAQAELAERHGKRMESEPTDYTFWADALLESQLTQCRAAVERAQRELTAVEAEVSRRYEETRRERCGFLSPD